MKKLIILTLISFALAGLGNMFSKNLTGALGSRQIPTSGWAMFKELFQ
ncbi:MAG: hypothetical protein ABIW76_05460 [Fibrobacteria bacterium]